jgi:DNA invertase Pin-like site-specific DNA recombinase
MIYGYARVSSEDQNLSRQIEALRLVGCEKIFEEKLSGATTDRPSLQDLLNTVQEGDTIIVKDLTRISRSTKDMFDLIEALNEKGVALKSIAEPWLDTTSTNPYNEFLLTIFAGLAQLERNLIKQRQREGIELAKQRGVYKGRPRTYTERHKGMQYAIKLFKERDENKMTVDEICEITNVSRATLYRAVKQQRVGDYI